MRLALVSHLLHSLGNFTDMETCLCHELVNSCPDGKTRLIPLLPWRIPRSRMSYMYVPKPPLAYTCYVPQQVYVPQQCVVPQAPEVYYQPPPQAYAVATPPVDYVYQPPAQCYQPPAQVYRYQPPAQVYYAQSPAVRVQ
jgi:hypothetical protein